MGAEAGTGRERVTALSAGRDTGLSTNASTASDKSGGGMAGGARSERDSTREVSTGFSDVVLGRALPNDIDEPAVPGRLRSQRKARVRVRRLTVAHTMENNCMLKSSTLLQRAAMKK